MRTDAVADPDFRVFFESAPGLYLVLLADCPKFTIVAVSDAYLRATMTKRAEILGKGLFDVFLDNPDDPKATGVENLRASLLRVLGHQTPDVMSVQKYDVRRSEEADGGFEERFWRSVNSPMFDRGRKIAYINHRVEDVTEIVRTKATALESGGAGSSFGRVDDSPGASISRSVAFGDCGFGRSSSSPVPDWWEAGNVVPPYITAALETKRVQYRQEPTKDFLSELLPVPSDRQHAERLGLTSYAVVPLVITDRIIGLLTFGSDQSQRRFEQSDTDFFEAFARRVALSIENARLFRDSQMDTKFREDVLAVVSHDLKNPLAAIGLAAQLLPMFQGNDGGKLSGIADKIQNSVGLMEKLIGDLLDFSKIHGGALSVEKIRNVLRAC